MNDSLKIETNPVSAKSQLKEPDPVAEMAHWKHGTAKTKLPVLRPYVPLLT